jgi:hypothetical protein
MHQKLLWNCPQSLLTALFPVRPCIEPCCLHRQTWSLSYVTPMTQIVGASGTCVLLSPTQVPRNVLLTRFLSCEYLVLAGSFCQ